MWCDRCPDVATFVVICVYGHVHSQCRECARFTAQEKIDFGE